MPRFLIDEDLPRSLKTALEREGLGAEDARGVGLQGHSDADVFAYAVMHHLALVTADVGFGDVRVYELGMHHGIVLVRYPSKTPVRLLNAAIVAPLRLLPEEDLRGNLVVLEPGRMRIRRKR